jgi:hypothetical protein
LRKLLYTALIMILLVMQASPGALAAFEDITTNWARKAITDLEERGVFTGVFDTEYGPHQPLEAAAFSVLVQRAFALDEPLDLGVEPEELVTRAMLASATAQALGIGAEHISLAKSYPSFEDLEPDHPVYLEVEVLRSLGVLPTYILNRFEPDRPATRAEVAHLLSQVSAWQQVTGKVSEVAEDGEQLTVVIEGELVSLTLSPETVVYSGGQLSSVDALTVGDAVFALYDSEGEAVLVSEPQRGLAALVDSEALVAFLNNAGQVLTDVLTPEQVSAILNGDWQALSDEVRYELHQRLVELGVSPWEVDALLQQDWAAVQEIVKDRLAAEAAERLNVSPELVFSAINRNWDTLLEYAQVELAQRLLTSSWLKEAN